MSTRPDCIQAYLGYTLIDCILAEALLQEREDHMLNWQV
jgi:hypothetical protein